ncbi:hypothetical protein TrVE_jg4210 [Triparma verrucosa]|uniref:Uncharacterized protein n=2 Tax=Triparma TaxID=722752 RepID=A0A9W7AIG8_9STRA|nr:hypothetical protein TrST_g4685 [Triparma strigata]GMH97988.1 hypothetical protein TrVE_jg4210 [Triparma verrucosa]
MEGGTGQPVIDVVLPTYIMTPSETEKFYPSEVKAIADAVMKEELDGDKITKQMVEDWYDDGEDFENLSKSIADKIRQRVKETLNVNRYKLVVQVTLGQMKDQGVRITSRCLWDTQTDNYASIDYKNEFIWGSAMVFGLYAE